MVRIRILRLKNYRILSLKERSTGRDLNLATRGVHSPYYVTDMVYHATITIPMIKLTWLLYRDWRGFALTHVSISSPEEIFVAQLSSILHEGMLNFVFY